MLQFGYKKLSPIVGSEAGVVTIMVGQIVTIVAGQIATIVVVVATVMINCYNCGNVACMLVVVL